MLSPEDAIAAHSSYAVAHEFPWFPFLATLNHFEEAKQAVRAAILQALPEGAGTYFTSLTALNTCFHERKRYNQHVFRGEMLLKCSQRGPNSVQNPCIA